MNLDPLWLGGPVVSAHALVAILALLIGSVQLAFPKGTALHRGIGAIWVALMAGVAISGFWIHEIRLFGPFSPIHLLSVLTLSILIFSMVCVRIGRIDGHRRSMILLYLMGLVLTGAFTLLPGRIMHAVFFGG
ncbi:MAG: DUF2306 domain-containing protein [Gammaproteobacteria bacterium]|nr:DUF2306 domain-containing protein [Gammaproteobacteria bacterium]